MFCSAVTNACPLRAGCWCTECILRRKTRRDRSAPPCGPCSAEVRQKRCINAGASDSSSGALVGVHFSAMLHALLHGKLEETVPEPQRLEDALTSSVFGALIWLDAWDVLARWLGVPFEDCPAHGEMPSRECWFWPRMAFAEPDVVLRLGNTLVVIEAKYGSDRHDLIAANDDDKDRCDQIVRQYRCITEPLSRRVRYAEPIERAVRECRLMQVFLVDARRQRRALRELEQSKERLPTEASLKLVTWQSLFRMLNAENAANRRWVTDLRAYLQRSGLDTFDGISRHMASIVDFQTIQGWRSGSDTAKPHFLAACTFELSQAAVLQGWRLPKSSERKTSLYSIDPEILEGRA